MAQYLLSVVTPGTGEQPTAEQLEPIMARVEQLRTDMQQAGAWVFAGGAFWRAEDSDKEIFIPNTTGNLICVANFEDAVLDVPTRSTTTDVALLFEAFAERIPERGTPVTLILKPQLEAKE